VEITFEGVRWIPAKIVRLQHPGAWVVTAGGALWFVTNGRRIRKLGAAAEEAAE
jgi:hypothetical protein